MRTLPILVLLFFHISAVAQIPEQHDEAFIHSIDTHGNSPSYAEASEAAIPGALYDLLMQQMALFQFTLLEETVVAELFETLEKDPRARMKNPEGRCAERRAYIQELLKTSKIVSGQLFIQCPKNDGRLRLKDQVSGSFYTYTNYHDSNIVAVNTGSGVELRVLDLQFEKLPLSFSEYVGEVEASQKTLLPQKTKGTESSRGKCFWSISTPYQTF